MDLKQLIGLRIKEQRLKCGLKQAELAEKVNVAAKHQSCIETGKNFPSADLIEKYARVFKIDVADLLIISQNKDRKTIEKELIEIIKKANDDEIKLAYKILKGIFI
ncbi:MAG: helix-turn-helix transcriptional regulator [bacterium]|nr:helix-turn-helix transcriptional regulator [bacterium]